MIITEEAKKVKQRRKIIETIIRSGLQITPSALKIIEEAINNKNITLTKVILYHKHEKIKIITKNSITTLLKNKIEDDGAFSKNYTIKKQSFLKILRDYSNCKYKSHSIDGFHSYFTSRFNKIKKIINERINVRNVYTIEEIKKISKNEKNKEVKFIAMISEVEYGKKENMILNLEDLTGNIKGIFNMGNSFMSEDSFLPINDSVLLVTGITVNEKIVKIVNFDFPDVPTDTTIREEKEDEEEVYTVFISDIHVGSKEFLEDSFKKFLRWVNLKFGNEEMKNIAEKVRYILIGGDLVDGIGVYPHQDEDLVIRDIFEQYEYFAHLISEIPDNIKIVVIPGNHDATTQALPQRKILEKYAKPLYKMKNVIMLGNPTILEINRVKILMAHGRSLEDIINVIPSSRSNRPERLMMYLLKVRHIAPIWGGKTPIAPCEEDNLVMDVVPNIFHMGHLHINGIGKYRNVLIINSGCFQAQTSYQKMSGINPTPGLVPVVNLKNMDVRVMRFY
ncbi:MAG: DNA-directed DNA polymerase II small subunit [Candidatus Asgardarchaeia archaeon]